MRKFKIKFKIYPWTTINTDHLYSEKSIWWGIELLPAINFDYHHDAFTDEEDGDSEYYMITLMFSWLIFGITFDWRKEWEQFPRQEI